MLFKGTKAFLPPALTDPDQDGTDQFHHTAFVPQRRNDLGSTSFFFQGPCGQISGAHVGWMAVGDIEVVQTCLGGVEQAATRFRDIALVARDNEGAPPSA
jgi:hypothetical protein